MTTTVTRVVANVASSIFQFLRTQPYQADAVTAPLLTHFPQLTLVADYPSDLTKLLTPTVAVGTLSTFSTDALYYGEGGQDQVLGLDVYGFVLKQGQDRNNRLYRDRLSNDVFALFDTIGRHQGITLYEYASQSEIGQIEVVMARLRMLPATVPAVEADRFKFIVELELGYTAEVAVTP